MTTHECLKNVDRLVARLQRLEPNDFRRSSKLLQVFAGASLLESTLSTWIAIWESGIVHVKELLNFYAVSFKQPVKEFIQYLQQRENDEFGTDPQIVRKLLTTVAKIDVTEECEQEAFDKLVIQVLLASMLLRQILHPFANSIEGLDSLFNTYSDSIDKEFFAKCILRSDYKITDFLHLSRRQIAVSIILGDGCNLTSL